MDPTCTWTLEESDYGISAGVQVFRRLEGGPPCEITLQTPPGAAALGVLQVVSNARLCELYVRSPGEAAASYACTLRGEPYPANHAVFIASYQGALRPGCALTLRMLSLTPSKDELRLHSIAWGPPEGKSVVQAALAARAAAPTAAASAAAVGDDGEGGGHSRGSRELELPAWDRERGPPGGQPLQEDEGEEEQGTEGQPQQQQSGEEEAQVEGGCSQMDEIRSMLRSAALQGGDGGDPKRALMAALARSALSQGRPASAAPFPGDAGLVQPPWAALMQAAMQAVAQPPGQPSALPSAAHTTPAVPLHMATGAAAAAAGISLQGAAAPAVSGEAPLNAPPARARMQALAAATTPQAAGAAAAMPPAPAAGAVGPEDLAAVQRWLSRELVSLEQVIAKRLEARLDRLDASLLSCSGVGGLSNGAVPGRSVGDGADSRGEQAGAAGSRQGGEQQRQQQQDERGGAELNGGQINSAPLLLERQARLEERMRELEERMAGLERLGEEIKSLLLRLVPT